MRKRSLHDQVAVGAVAVAGLLSGWAAPAAAQERQDAPPPDQTSAPPVPPTPSTNAAAPAEQAIVVTGSRIKRNEFTSATPIQVIDPTVSEKRGLVDTASLIQSSSVAAGSPQLTATISSNLVSSNGGKGAETVSLRGLGAARTLVLLNGRRAGPAGTRGGVSSFDLNVLPEAVVSSVEIVKTGASSVYGSDAIAGVVNIITKRKTDGFELDGFSSVPFAGGGEEYRAALTYGKDFGRGHFLVSFDYYQHNELKRGDRAYLNCPEEYIFRKGSGTRADIIDPRTGSYRCEDSLWGQIWLYDYQGNGSNLIAPNGQRIRRLQYDYNHNLAQFIPPLSGSGPGALRVPPGWFPTGYDARSKSVENAMHPFISDTSMVPRARRLTFYGDASFQIADGIEWYGELLRNRRDTYQNGFRIYYQYGTFTSDFSFAGLSAGSGDPLSAGFTGAVVLSPTPITDHNDSSQRVDYTRVVSGLRGKFGGWLRSWSWDTYVQYSRSNGTYTTDQIYNDALASQNYRTGSCVGTFTAVRHVPCIDINFLNPDLLAGKLTDAERAFLFGTETGRTIYTQWNAEASATGNLVRLPAGNVAAAFGATWRRDEINDTPGDITHALLPGKDPNDPNSYVNNAWLASAAGVTAGRSVTNEVFGELEVPLIYNTPLIRSFTLSGSARLTNVKSTRTRDRVTTHDNGNFTYSLGANWNVNQWVRFRGTYGTSFRAPALFEQFLADQTSFVTQRGVDPCIGWGAKLAAGSLVKRIADNCAAAGIPATFAGGALEALVTTGGGLGVLKSETSTARTASIILTPRFSFLPNTQFNLAVDYVDIHVKGEIAQIGAKQVVTGCYNSQFYPKDPLCQLFTRAPATAAIPFTIQTVRDALVNVNSERNRAIDVTASVRQRLGSWGTLSFLAQMTWQLKDEIALFSGTTESNNGEAGKPKWVGNFNLTWSKGGTTIFYGLDAIGATSNEADFIRANGTLCPTSPIYGDYCVDVTAPRRLYHSASITQKIGGKFEITAGVANILNTKPPRVTIEGGTLNANVVSTIGQSLFSSQYDYIGRRAFINVKARF